MTEKRQLGYWTRQGRTVLLAWTIVLLGGCATPKDVFVESIRMAQETEQTCGFYRELLPLDGKPLAEEVKARLRLRLTGMSCRLMSGMGAATTSPDGVSRDCRGSGTELIRSIPAALGADVDTLKEAVASDIRLSRESLDGLKGSVSRLKSAVERLPERLERDQRSALLERVRQLEAVAAELERRVANLSDASKDSLAELARLRDQVVKSMHEVHGRIDSVGVSLGAMLDCEDRRACAHTLVSQLAQLSTQSDAGGIAASLERASSSVQALQQLLGRSRPESVIADIAGLLGRVQETGNAIGHAAVSLETSAEVAASLVAVSADLMRTSVAMRDAAELPNVQKAMPNLRKTVERTINTFRSGLRATVRLASGDVQIVVDDLFSLPVQYAAADRSLAIVERALKPADRLIERIDDRFYFLGSIALAWNEVAVQQQFDQLFEELRLTELMHPRLQLAFGVAACQRLGSTQTNSQLAPFLYRTITGSLPRGLCQSAAEEMQASGRGGGSSKAFIKTCKAFEALTVTVDQANLPQFAAKFGNSCTKASSTPEEWTACLDKRRSQLQGLVAGVHRHFLDINKDLPDLVVAEQCEALHVRGPDLSAGDVARICGAQLEADLPRLSPRPTANAGSAAQTQLSGVESKREASDRVWNALGKTGKETVTSSAIPLTDESFLPLANLTATAADNRELINSLEASQGAAIREARISKERETVDGKPAGPTPAAKSPEEPKAKKSGSPSGIEDSAALCSEFERRLPSLVQCDVVKGDILVRVLKTFRSGRWNDPAVEGVLEVIAQTARASTRRLAFDIEAGASSSAYSCTAASSRPGPPAASTKRNGNRVLVQYAATNDAAAARTLDVDCREPQAGNQILAFQRAAWSAELLARAAGDAVEIGKVGRLKRAPSSGYDSEWDRFLVLTIRQVP